MMGASIKSWPIEMVPEKNHIVLLCKQTVRNFWDLLKWSYAHPGWRYTRSFSNGPLFNVPPFKRIKIEVICLYQFKWNAEKKYLTNLGLVWMAKYLMIVFRAWLTLHKKVLYSAPVLISRGRNLEKYEIHLISCLIRIVHLWSWIVNFIRIVFWGRGYCRQRI